LILDPSSAGAVFLLFPSDFIVRYTYYEALTLILSNLLTILAAKMISGTEMMTPVEAYRAVVQSKDKPTDARAALDLRHWMIENDPHMPVYHFTGPECWINDPNGVIYHKGGVSSIHISMTLSSRENAVSGAGGMRSAKISSTGMTGLSRYGPTRNTTATVYIRETWL
jgi:hypothetical protein